MVRSAIDARFRRIIQQVHPVFVASAPPSPGLPRAVRLSCLVNALERIPWLAFTRGLLIGLACHGVGEQNGATPTYIQATWFDKDIAPPQFKEAVFDQRRESAANMLWQLKQDIDHYNEFDNPGEPYQTTFDFMGDMADREAGRELILETQSEDDDYDEEFDDFDHRLDAAT